MLGRVSRLGRAMPRASIRSNLFASRFTTAQAPRTLSQEFEKFENEVSLMPNNVKETLKKATDVLAASKQTKADLAAYEAVLQTPEVKAYFEQTASKRAAEADAVAEKNFENKKAYVMGSEGMGGFSELGIYPLAGLGLAAALSKEFLILNDDIYIFLNFAVFTTGIYVAFGRSLGEWLRKDGEEEVAKVASAIDFAHASTNVMHQHYTNQTKIGEKLQQFNTEYQKELDLFVAAKERQQVQQVNARYTDMLEKVAFKEQDNEAGYKQAILDELLKNVNAQASSPAMVKLSTDQAIDRIGFQKNNTGDASKDSVPKTFKEEWEKLTKDKTLNAKLMKLQKPVWPNEMPEGPEPATWK